MAIEQQAGQQPSQSGQPSPQMNEPIPTAGQPTPPPAGELPPPAQPAAQPGQPLPQASCNLLVAEFTQAREELRYQDNHIWNIAKFYMTTLGAGGGALAVLLKLGSETSGDVQKKIWLAVMAAGIPFVFFGFLLFHRILAHHVYFRAWCKVTDIIRKQLLMQFEWFEIPKLLFEEEGKEHRHSGWVSWHNTLFLIVLGLNAMLAALLAFATYKAELFPDLKALLPPGAVEALVALLAVTAGQILFARAYRNTQAPKLETSISYNRTTRRFESPQK